MTHCDKKDCILYGMTILANIALIGFAIFMALNTYNQTDAMISLLLIIPPVLSLMALKKQGDKEERTLKKRIRKAQLRKDLQDLKEFDKD